MTLPTHPQKLRIKIFGDGAERDGILALAQEPWICGFTTNPTLMKKAGITDYAGFAQDVLKHVTDKPVSFEVFSDDFTEMERQARIIHAWAPNVYVKIPVMNTRRTSSAPLIARLSREGIKLNVTAILTLTQVAEVGEALSENVPSIVSVFAGRIADTGVNPVPIMRDAKMLLAKKPNAELLWASPRQLYNLYEAEEAGTDIITLSHDLLKKIGKIGFDLHELSLDTVKMFYDDGQKVGYRLYGSDVPYEPYG